MTYTIRLRITILLLTLSISAYAQDDSYLFQCNEEEHLESALERFAQSYDIKLGYPAFILDKIYPGALSIQNDNIEALLHQVLTPSDIEYQVLEGKKILLRKVSYYQMDIIDESSKLTLSGSIKSEGEYSSLEYATVSIPRLSIGTYTDENGNYELELASSALDEEVIISYIGYISDSLKVKDLLNKSKIILKPSTAQIAEVTVSGSKPLVIINQLSANTALRLTDLLSIGANTIQSDDLLRKLQYLPGISTADDKSSAVKIRGADESETLVMVDGIPIYKTDHFYGIFGNVNGNYIDDITLYKNELPINHSGKSGGMVSMTSKSKFNSIHGSANVDLLNTSLNIGVPLADGWNLLAAGRASYNNVANAGFFDKDANFNFLNNNSNNQINFNRPTVIGVTPSFDFYDVNAKLAYTRDKLKFNANFFKSFDMLESYYENSFTSRGPRGMNRPVTNEERFSNEDQWSNNGASINLMANLANGWQLSSTSYYTHFYDSNALSFSLTSDNPIDPINNQINNGNNNSISDWSSTLMLTKSIGTTSFNIGAKYTYHQNDLSLGEDGNEILSNSRSAQERGLFVSANHNINDQLVVNGGLRATQYNLTDEIYISPQISAAYQVDPSFSLKSSYSINYQYVRELAYSNRFGEEIELFTLSNGRKFPVGQSNNYMLGGTYKLDKWLMDVELYHIDRHNVLNLTTFQSRLINGSRNDDSNFNLLVGDGRTRGMDMLLSYQSKSYVGMLSYTLSKSENSFKEIFKNDPFPSQDDRRHQLSITNTYLYKNWDVSANAVYTSGLTYTDISALTTGQDRRNNKPRDYLRKLPHYLRFDLSAGHTFDLGSNKAKVSLSVLNLLNRQNVKYLQFTGLVPINSDNQQGNNEPPKRSVIGTVTQQLDRTINASVKLSF